MDSILSAMNDCESWTRFWNWKEEKRQILESFVPFFIKTFFPLDNFVQVLSIKKKEIYMKLSNTHKYILFIIFNEVVYWELFVS